MGELFDSLAGRSSFTRHFCPVFNCILQPTGRTSNVLSSKFVGPVIPDNRVKFGDPRINLSREISHEAAGISDGFLAVASDRT